MKATENCNRYSQHYSKYFLDVDRLVSLSFVVQCLNYLAMCRHLPQLPKSKRGLLLCLFICPFFFLSEEEARDSHKHSFAVWGLGT